MLTFSFDAGGKIDAGAFVTMRQKGDFKAPVPQDTSLELVEAKLIEPKTMPKDYSEMVGYYIPDEKIHLIDISDTPKSFYYGEDIKN